METVMVYGVKRILMLDKQVKIEILMHCLWWGLQLVHIRTLPGKHFFAVPGNAINAVVKTIER